MAKKEETVDYTPQDFEIDNDSSLETVEVEKPVATTRVSHRQAKEPVRRDSELVNCLRNERVIVRHIPK